MATSYLAQKFVPEGLTYDDVLLVPDYSEILPREVNIASYFTRDIKLVPLEVDHPVMVIRSATAMARRNLARVITTTCSPLGFEQGPLGRELGNLLFCRRGHPTAHASGNARPPRRRAVATPYAAAPLQGTAAPDATPAATARP